MLKMTAKDYEKLSLELTLRGFEIDSHKYDHQPGRAYLMKDGSVVFNDKMICGCAGTEKAARRKLLNYIAENKNIIY